MSNSYGSGKLQYILTPPAIDYTIPSNTHMEFMKNKYTTTVLKTILYRPPRLIEITYIALVTVFALHTHIVRVLHSVSHILLQPQY